MPFQDAKNRNLIPATSSHDLLTPLADVHIAGKSADEGFIDFNFAAQLSAIIILKCEPDAVHHEPRGFLSHAKPASYFITANSILAASQHPNSGKPLVESNRRVLKYCSDFDGELPFRVMTRALPHVAGRIEFHFLRATSWAGHTFGPTLRRKVLKAIRWAREVYHSILKGSWFAHDFVPHKQNHSRSKWMSQVNYCPN
jgi:hypothetical protein